VDLALDVNEGDDTEAAPQLQITSQVHRQLFLFLSLVPLEGG